MKIYWVRHGQTQANIDGVYYGASDLPLIEAGEKQAREIADQLREIVFDNVITSGLCRTIQTATIIQETSTQSQPPVIESFAELNETDFGEWELRHYRDLKQEDSEAYRAWCSDWQNVIPPGGEGFLAFSARIENALLRLQQELPENSTVLIVGHQGVLSIMLALLLGLPPSAMWNFSFKHGCYSLTELNHGHCVVHRLNDSGKAQMH